MLNTCVTDNQENPEPIRDADARKVLLTRKVRNCDARKVRNYIINVERPNSPCNTIGHLKGKDSGLSYRPSVIYSKSRVICIKLINFRPCKAGEGRGKKKKSLAA